MGRSSATPFVLCERSWDFPAKLQPQLQTWDAAHCHGDWSFQISVERKLRQELPLGRYIRPAEEGTNRCIDRYFWGKRR